MRGDLEQLCRKLEYTFKDKKLLSTALSHRSVHGENNERLEFVGDSIVNFIIAEALYARFPKAKEGDLSRMRASLVRGETLASLAQQFDLGDYLRLGSGELKSGGFRRESILADAIEAIIAAIYYDAGLATCQQCVLRWYQSRLDNMQNIKTHKDAKSILQEYLQSNKHQLPTYEVTQIEGEAHEQVFHVQCRVADLKLSAKASGMSRRKAEQSAAEKILLLIQETS
jgi:ribonuclease-3